MEFAQISEALQHDAVWVIFVNVLLQQLGLPVPAVPTLLVAGSLAADPARAGSMLVAAVFASVIADAAWYLVGRALGYRVLSGLCRISINPASCVTQTEERFLRWGAWSLVVAKFVPGFSTVAPPIAGTLRMGMPRFLLAAGAGAAAWAGLAILFGWVLRAEIQAVLARLTGHGTGTVVTILAVLGVWLCWKLWQKHRFERLAAIPHIAPDELLEAMASGTPLLVLDLRSAAMITETQAIPGAVVARHEDLDAALGDWPSTAPIVTVCACPQDAGALQAAHDLLKRGYQSVRPLRGGFDAWQAAQSRASAAFSAL